MPIFGKYAGLCRAKSGGCGRAAASDGCLSAESTSLSDRVGPYSIVEAVIEFNSSRGGPACPAAGAAFYGGSSVREVSGIIERATVVTLVLATCLSCSRSLCRKARRNIVSRVGPHANISVDTQYGAISVKPGSGNQVVVTATLKSENVEVDQQQNGNRIEIASHLLQGTDQQQGPGRLRSR